jgi:hypothetical protein
MNSFGKQSKTQGSSVETEFNLTDIFKNFDNIISGLTDIVKNVGTTLNNTLNNTLNIDLPSEDIIEYNLLLKNMSNYDWDIFSNLVQKDEAAAKEWLIIRNPNVKPEIVDKVIEYTKKTFELSENLLNIFNATSLDENIENTEITKTSNENSDQIQKDIPVECIVEKQNIEKEDKKGKKGKKGKKDKKGKKGKKETKGKKGKKKKKGKKDITIVPLFNDEYKNESIFDDKFDELTDDELNKALERIKKIRTMINQE